MKRLANDKSNPVRTELRITMDATDYADLCSLAKVSGLASTQYARQVLKRHLARIYASAETKESTP